MNKILKYIGLSIGFVSTIMCFITFYYINTVGGMLWVEPNVVIRTAELYLTGFGVVLTGGLLFRELVKK